MNICKSVVFLCASLIVLAGVSLSAQAASVCKGLDSDACEANVSCSLVAGYTRKDGREVKAFCRTSTKGRVKASAKKELLGDKTET